jgi:hypothetical protein
MTAYVIFIREKTVDQHELEIYAQKATFALAGLQFTMLSAYQRIEAFEGDLPEGIVLFSFPAAPAVTSAALRRLRDPEHVTRRLGCRSRTGVLFFHTRQGTRQEGRWCRLGF